MPVADSIPRKIIAHLRAVMPQAVAEPIHWDAVAQWRKEAADEPVCIVVAHPSIPEVRRGGIVDADTRNLVVGVDLIWDAKDGGHDGKNYDRFEETINALADALAGLQGTAVLGGAVLQSTIDPDECEVGADVDIRKYIARLKVDIQFTR